MTSHIDHLLSDFERRRHAHTGETELEVFLDFDPVFPGWPPEDEPSADANTMAGYEGHVRRALNPAIACSGDRDCSKSA